MEHQQLVQQYIALWNELNATQRLKALQQVMTADASYQDPQMSGQGHAGISDMIGAAQAQLPGLHFRLSERPIEAHHDYLRFSWLLGPDDQTAMAGGADVVRVRGGQMVQVIGFIDFAPPAGE